MKANCRPGEKAASKYISTRTGSTGVFPTSFSRKRSLINIFVFFFRETAFVGSTKTIRSCKMEEEGCWLFFSSLRARKRGKTCTITKANNFGGKRRYGQDFLPILWDYKSLYHALFYFLYKLFMHQGMSEQKKLANFIAHILCFFTGKPCKFRESIPSPLLHFRRVIALFCTRG